MSAVDVRSFLAHLSPSKKAKEEEKKKEEDEKQAGIELIQRHFPIWWPNGRDLMISVILSSVSSNVWAYTQTNDNRFLYTAGFIGFLAPFTVFILGEDIEKLRRCNGEEVESTARRFCFLHHFRLLSAGIGFGLALTALADL